MASGNRNVVPGIAIADKDGKRRKYLDTATGKIQELPTQKMVFDKDSGKLMAVVSENKTIALDNQVFTEMDADGFFVANFMTILICHQNQQRQWQRRQKAMGSGTHVANLVSRVA